MCSYPINVHTLGITSSDDHRIHSFEVYELNEQTKHVAKKKADFKMTDEMNQVLNQPHSKSFLI